jgi:hypothetical protein
MCYAAKALDILRLAVKIMLETGIPKELEGGRRELDHPEQVKGKEHEWEFDGIYRWEF